MATIPQIKEYLPVLYKILYDRACEVVDKNQALYGFSTETAKAFKYGHASSLGSCFVWSMSPEDNEFWSELKNICVDVLKYDERYSQYRTETIIYDMWI